MKILSTEDGSLQKAVEERARAETEYLKKHPDCTVIPYTQTGIKMTDEEMAEEWVKNNCCDLCVCQDECEIGCIHCGVKDGFLAGLKLGRQDEQLSKAKEHINKLLCLLDDFAEDEIDSGGRDFMEQARQFLKEIEK